MEQIDERIMEYARHNGWASPSLLESERGFSASEGRIRERCLRLWFVGFIEPIAGEMYDITMEGSLYLEGKVDARNYPNPKPCEVFEDRFPTPAKYPPGPVRIRIERDSGI